MAWDNKPLRIQMRTKRNADMTVNAQETWLVTGAASGIGAAVVRAVRQAGHPVLALDVNDVAGQRLESETGGRHWTVLVQSNLPLYLY